jgi:hypothetical protein
MLTNGTASAEQSEAGDRQVTFAGGGVLGFSCRSHPDVESLVVPAYSTIRVVNRTGYSAELQLGGEATGMLADDSSTDVLFRHGSTTVVVEPNCPLGEDVVPLEVTVSPSPSPTASDPAPSPSSSSSGGAVTPSDTPSGPVGTTQPGSVPTAAPTTRPTTRPTKTAHVPVLRNSTVTRAAATAAQGMPQGGNAGRAKNRTTTSTAGSTVPAYAGMPPGKKETLLAGVPTLEAPAMSEAAPAAESPAPTDGAAAEPVAEMAPIRNTSSLGLLGLIAAVCVLGVGAAAIRAIVSQRVNRANLA